MSQSQEILSPRPQRHQDSFAKIIAWKEGDHMEGLASGVQQDKDYIYMRYGGAYNERVLAQCRALARDAAVVQYAVENMNFPSNNQAPPWPPVLRAIPNASRVEQAQPQQNPSYTIVTQPVPLTSNDDAEGRAGQNETFVGRDGTRWPMPPPECRPGGRLARRKPVPTVQYTLSQIKQHAPRTSCAADRPRTPPASDPETSESEYSQDDEAHTPPVGDLSLADLGRDWYASFGKEVGASPLVVDRAPSSSAYGAEVSSPESEYSQDHEEQRQAPPLAELSLVDLERDWYASFGQAAGARALPSVSARPWAADGGRTPNALWLPQAAQRRASQMSRLGEGEVGTRGPGEYAKNPWALLPDEDVPWGA